MLSAPGQELAQATQAAPAEIEEAFVFASTIGFHELRLNALVLGDGTDKLLEPGVGVYPLRPLFTTFDVTSLLRPGAPNTLGALLGQQRALRMSGGVYVRF